MKINQIREQFCLLLFFVIKVAKEFLFEVFLTKIINFKQKQDIFQGYYSKYYTFFNRRP
jgi:hypothetical protein